MIKNLKWLVLVSLTIVACNNNDDETTTDSNSIDGSPLTAGTANFSKYIALGNSLTAGYCDSALFIEGQKGSYTNILSQQFALVGGGEFKIPFMADNIGGFNSGGVQIPQFGPRLYLVTPPGAQPYPTPVSGVSGTSISAVLTGPFNNMGVPGAKSFHLITPGYGTLNPYFGRFASSPSTTVLADAVAQEATFFSLWIGNNDVLAYATSGGIGTNQTGNYNPATYGNNDITDPVVFENAYKALLSGTSGLTKNGAQGVVANIPYVNSIPYFTTVPYNPVPLDAATASLLNGPGGYGPYNAGLQSLKNAGLLSEEERARRTIVFQAGATNAVVMIDEYLTDLTIYNPGLKNYRQATKEDYLVLTSRSFIGTTVGGNPMLINGVSVPLADNWVLSKTEVAELKIATDAYNVAIKTLAGEYKLAFVDANKVLSDVASPLGLASNGFTMRSTYVSGGAFSLDGVHPSPRGYALIANEFMKAINIKYGSNFKGVNLGNYRILYPQALP